MQSNPIYCRSSPKPVHRSLSEHSEIDTKRIIISKGRIRNKMNSIEFCGRLRQRPVRVLRTFQRRGPRETLCGSYLVQSPKTLSNINGIAKDTTSGQDKVVVKMKSGNMKVVNIEFSQLNTFIMMIAEISTKCIPRDIPTTSSSEYSEDFPTNLWSSEFSWKFISSEFRRKFPRDFRRKMNFRGFFSSSLSINSNDDGSNNSGKRRSVVVSFISIECSNDQYVRLMNELKIVMDPVQMHFQHRARAGSDHMHAFKGRFHFMHTKLLEQRENMISSDRCDRIGSHTDTQVKSHMAFDPFEFPSLSGDIKYIRQVHVEQKCNAPIVRD
ncbi:LOW QUALITY PROTEIN: hypothetical protein YC2023_070779 [Brassica napus]